MRSGIAEASIYITADWRGRGVAKELMKELVECTEASGFYSIQAEVLSGNTASLNLCKKIGFREIGYRERFGRMPDGTWYDVFLMEKRREDD